MSVSLCMCMSQCTSRAQGREQRRRELDQQQVSRPIATGVFFEGGRRCNGAKKGKPHGFQKGKAMGFPSTNDVKCLINDGKSMNAPC